MGWGDQFNHLVKDHTFPFSPAPFPQLQKRRAHGTRKILRHLFLALQCRLECEPGYVAQRTPLITCVNGEYAKGCHYLHTLSLNSGRPRAILGIIGFDSSVMSSTKSKGKTTRKNIASYNSLSVLSPPCGRQALANNARLSSKTRKQGEGLRTIRVWRSKMF